ncbi:unnamed protein product [Linum trigynum]|uniref:Uncharacterized protein n=2 Tax=Linum trigynum TaxID=586398 RepID=A0AAV2D0B1_9ROSI
MADAPNPLDPSDSQSPGLKQLAPTVGTSMTLKDASNSKKGEERSPAPTKTPIKQVVGREAINPQPLTIQSLEASDDDDPSGEGEDMERLEGQLAKLREKQALQMASTQGQLDQVMTALSALTKANNHAPPNPQEATEERRRLRGKMQEVEVLPMNSLREGVGASPNEDAIEADDDVYLEKYARLNYGASEERSALEFL